MLDRIKALMAARQLSPSQFADQTTLPRPVVSHILSGRNKPSLEAAQKIMAAFPEVSIDWLLNGRGPMMVGAAAVSVMPTVPAPGPAAALAPPSGAGAPGAVAVTDAATDAAAPVAAPPARAKATRSTRPPQPVAVPAPFAPGPVAAPLPEQAAPASAPNTFSGELPAAAYVPHTVPSALAPSAAPAAPFNNSAPPVAPAPQLPTSLVPPAPAVVQQVIRPERVVRRILVFYSDGTFSDHRPLPPEEASFF